MTKHNTEYVRVSGTVQYEGSISLDKNVWYQDWLDMHDQDDPEQAAHCANYVAFREWVFEQISREADSAWVDVDYIGEPDTVEPSSMSLTDQTFYQDNWDRFTIKPILVHKDQGSMFPDLGAI